MITTEDGLANLMTSALHQDEKGFIWVGTKVGLNRYDGYHFKLFNKDKNGLTLDAAISAISEDENGNLWLKIDENEYITHYDIFDPIKEEAIPLAAYFADQLPFHIDDLFSVGQVPSSHTIWLATKKGELYFYQNEGFEIITEDLPSSIDLLVLDQEGDIWLGGKKNLIRVNRKGSIVERILLPNEVQRLWVGEDDKLWLNLKFEKDRFVTSSTIWSKSKHVSELKPYYLTIEEKKIITNKPIARTEEGLWYVCNDAHFYVFNQKGQLLFDYYDTFGITLKDDLPKYLDLGEEVWFTTSHGIVKTSSRQKIFSLIHDASISTDFRGITEDEQGKIYFLNNHLYCWSPKNNQIRQFSDFHGALDILYADSIIWTGIYEYNTLGVQLDLKTNQKIYYSAPNAKNAYCILATGREKQHFIGHEGGLSILDLNRQLIFPYKQYNEFEYLKSLTVLHLHQNDEGIWLATDKGIFLMTEEGGIMQHFDESSGHLPFNFILHIYEDEAGVFWMATRGGGLIQWKPVIDSEIPSLGIQYTTKDGLSNDYLYAVYGDDFDCLWITSDRGLMQMNKRTAEIFTYTTKDGLPHNEFNKTAHYQSKDGTLYFGGLGGLIMFHPSKFSKTSNSKIPIEFTSCQLLKEGETGMIDQTNLVESIDEVIITPYDKMLELKFALLDFDNPNNHLYAYQFEGYDDRWNIMKENYLRIMHLPYGRYTLKIKGQNINKGWSSKELELKIRVLKPFYLQWWFITGIVCSLIGLTIFIVKRRELIFKKNQRKLEEEVRKRTQKIEEDKKLIESQSETLRQLDKAKTRFFSNITHEFRTPLTLIIGPTEQLIENIPPPNIFKRRMNNILKNAHHLLELINQMLDISKIASKQMKVEIMKGDIIEYTRKLMERFKPLAQSKSQQLDFISNQTNWETHFDKEKWNKIVYNLVYNALKFTPKGGRIQLSLLKANYQGKESIQLEIKDSGIGINLSDLEQIFNRFYQVNNSTTRNQGGTGIGLALVKELVELQGGRIQVTSEVNKGTTFEVYLPVVTVDSPKLLNLTEIEPLIVAQLANEDVSIVSVNSKHKKLELLIVEDNEEIREYICHCIDPSRYHISQATNGAEGILRAIEIVPDLIISDVMMPQKDGFELVKEIRANIATSHIPIILLTAKASLESRLEGLKHGADAYLTKPFSPHELAVRIQKLIEIRQLLQNRYQSHQLLDETEYFQQEDTFITNLRNFITTHLNDPNLNVIRLCEHFGISRTQFYRKLNALIGKSVAEYIRSIRLETAKQLLTQQQLSIAEIAYSTGFSSPSHFTRTFKKAFGKPPSNY